MRTLSALLMVLLLCSLQQVYCGTEALGSMNDCCQKLTVLRKLPLARIKSYNQTSSSCAIKAVVFQMDTGKIFCVDPSLSWIETHKKAVDHRKTAQTAAKPNTSSKP
ncbi:regakine-1-like isoform X2 [Colossoma macropomum]|nr:regakine-1-like isoform X2 [Colossoma macropomum]